MRRASRADELLQLVHRRPEITRAAAAKVLGLGTGPVTELVGRLVDRELIGEYPAPPSGSRGRPTTVLSAHPHGPLVLTAAIGYSTWRLRAVELGGAVVASDEGTHHGQRAGAAMTAIGARIRRLDRRLPGRVRGLGVSVPGTVIDGTLRQASYLEWNDVDLRQLWPAAPILVTGNDATLAAAAESHRGAAVDASVSLHLLVEAGLGGAVVDRGMTATGALGVAGEYGHMPFGDPAVRCPCGAAGCWGTSVDGAAVARLLSAPAPAEPVRFFAEVIDRARTGGAAELAALGVVGGALGRGIAGLVNGLDPAVVTLGGFGVALLELAPEPLQHNFIAGLMGWRRADPPVILPAALGEDGPLVGAAEETWAQLWAGLVSGA